MANLLVSSIVTGSLFAIVALGLVAVYKTTRIFNFAHPEIVALSGYMGYQTKVVWEWPFLIALVVGILVGSAVSFVMEFVLLRRIYQKSALETVIATFGVSLIIQTAIVHFWGHEARGIPRPWGRSAIDLGFVSVPYYDLAILAFACATVTAITFVLGKTSKGLQLRAIFDDPAAGRLVGIRVGRVRTATWVLGGALGGAAGVMLAPVYFLSPGNLLPLLIAGFAAAVIGGFSSFYGTIVGAFAVAGFLNFVGSYVSISYRHAMLYGAIIVFIWLRPWGLFGQHEDWSEHFAINEGERSGKIRRTWNHVLARLASCGPWLRGRVLRGFPPQMFLQLAVVVALLAIGPIMGPEWNLNVGLFLVYFLATAGLSLALYGANQVSLAQNAFVAIGAYITMLMMTEDPGLWPLAILVSLASAAGVGALIAFPSVRAQGAYFVVITIALGMLAYEIAFKWTSVTGGYNGRSVPDPTLFGNVLTREQRFYVSAGVAVLGYIALIAFRNSRWGRKMAASRDSVNGAATLGISAKRWNIAAFSLSAAAAGVAGSLASLQFGYVSPTQLNFHFSLMVVVAAVLAGSITGSFWGALIVVLVPIWLKGYAEFAPAILGLLLIAIVLILPRDRSSVDLLRRVRQHRTESNSISVTVQNAALAVDAVSPNSTEPASARMDSGFGRHVERAVQ
jgi:branched-chain amino acid transport system permease protein